ncbi:NADPH-dependent FMN reductase [Citreicella sp. 357]|nr:NADPH-dependent FMN reductase [Citreicella sp. 357]
MTIELISGNPSAGGRTSQLARDLGAALAALLEDTPPSDVAELATLAPNLFGWGDPDVGALKARVLAADFVVLATPTYKAAMTGLLKSFLDQFNAGALVGQVVIPVFTAGSDAHSLAPDFTLRPVLQELGASMPTASLYVVSSVLDKPNEMAADFIDRERFRLLGAAHGLALAKG